MKNNFENLINKDKYQVFLFSCPALIPVHFARHPWFVVNKKGELHRYEIGDIKIDNSYFHIDVFPPFQGIEHVRFIKNYFWKANLLGCVEGDENSKAKEIINFLEKSKETYPYCGKYFFLGPNSNTYAQNVLNKFPEFKVKFSWRFFGKNFKIKL